MDRSRPLHSVEDMIPHIKFIRNKRQEYFICLSLDSAGRLIRRRTVTIGLLDAVMTHPRETFAGPVRDRAGSIIVAHNHPSGDPEPSKQDISTTQQLVAAGQLLGIPLVDHIIIAGNKQFSFRRNGFLWTSV